MKIRNLLFLMLGLASTQASASLMNLSTLKETLKQNNATWQAKDSWVNNLSEEQIHKVLGYKHKVVTERDVDFRPMNELAGTDSIDWRNKDGQNWVSPVLNQGNCGSCVAFATIGTLETQMNISSKANWLNNRYSAEALFACGGGGCDSGWEPQSAASYLRSHGVPDEACAPYTMGATGVDSACNSICSDAGSRSQKISNFTSTGGFLGGSGNAAKVKQALQHGPVVTTLDVYADFLSYGSGIYKHVAGAMEGGHAVSIVGYNDAGRYWIVRNSWGPDWGENGFVRVSYDDTSGIGNETWSFALPSTDGVAGIQNLQDRSYISGSIDLQANSTYPNTSDMTLQMVDPSGSRTTMNCKGSSCPFHIDSTKLADGRYVANLLVNYGGKQVQSERKFFYVVNKRPENFSLSFTPQSGTDLSKPISGRPVFNVEATSSSVPFSDVSIIVKQGDKIVMQRGDDIILPQMTMGWRTTVIPNGTYDVYLQGRISTERIQYQVESNHYTVTVKN